MFTRPALPRFLAALTVFVQAACSGSDQISGNASVPTTLSVVTAAPASAAAGTLLTSPSFVVKDQNGQAMADVPVTLSVSGGGVLTGQPARSAAGAQTPVGAWKLGTTVGENALTISAGELLPLTIKVQAVPGVAAQIAVIQGNNQLIMAGRAAQPVVFAVRDQFGNGVSGTPVSFSVVGGGSVAGATVTSAVDGSVTAPAWQVGKSAIPQQLRASGGSFMTAANATIETSFAISVRYYGPAMSVDQEALFTAAAQRIAAMVVGDLPDVSAPGIDLATFCETPGLPVLNEIVDDVIIYASIKAIDGPGKVLAQAGPCAIRSAGSKLPIIGIMEFDEADLASMAGQGSLQEVITHEMMHVLGIGTFWNSAALLADYNTSSVAYVGAAAGLGCRDHGGASLCASTVPVENLGGAGTANAHWRESVFGNEIMTGYANSGGMPISRMTIGAFADLGYVTNADAAAIYRIPGTAALSAASGVSLSVVGGRAQSWERTLEPKILISRTGRVETFE